MGMDLCRVSLQATVIGSLVTTPGIIISRRSCYCAGALAATGQTMQAGMTASIHCCNHRRSTPATMPSASTLDSQMPASHARRFQSGDWGFSISDIPRCRQYPAAPAARAMPSCRTARQRQFAWFLIFVQI